MENDNLKLAKRFAKNQPVIIALFAVFTCSFAAIVLHFSYKLKDNAPAIVLTYILVLGLLIVFSFVFCQIVFCGFSCLRKRCDKTFLKMDMENLCTLMARVQDLAKNIDSAKDIDSEKIRKNAVLKFQKHE